MAGPRKLGAQDAEVWDKVARSVRKLHPARPVAAPMPEKPLNAAPQGRQSAQMIVPSKPVRKAAAGPMVSVSRVPDVQDALSATPLRMDARVFDKLTRGKLAPEGRIDLHGMTLTEAHNALVRFIIRSHADKKRLVLVITGKGGRPDHQRETGVLRRQVPHWLQVPPLSAHVQQIVTANVRHGGSGAYYIYLRKV
jgi:DNA-nicking Smr family endonuclease